MQMTILFSQGEFGEVLSLQPLTLPAGSPKPEIGPPMRVPGSMAGWFEMAVNFGVVSLPAGVLAGCIANWITSARSQRKANAASFKAKLVFEKDGREVEIELTAGDSASLAEIIEDTLVRVHSE